MTPFAPQFNSALTAAGLAPLVNPVVDDQIHRFASPPDKEANSWYVLHNGGQVVVGAYGCWRRDFWKPFCSKDQGAMSKDEQRSLQDTLRTFRKALAAEEAANQEKVRLKCRDLFSRSPRATAHAYLSAKSITASPSTAISNYDIYPGWLAVPLQDSEGTIQSAQFIAEDGTKRFFYQGRIKGCFHQFSDVNHGGPILVCEGYATGASLYLATGWTVRCAMTCGNLESVTKSARSQFPTRTIVIAADNDQFTEGNPGLTHAKSAARTTKSLLSFPEFADESLDTKPTDFNDLHRLAGLPEVRRQIHRAIPSLKLLSERQFNPNIEPPKIVPIYSLQGKIISTPGNLSSITSGVKSGKSSTVCAMMASAFPHPDDADLLGFTSENPSGKAIIHIDSEQSTEDHWWYVHRMLVRCNLKIPPPWFYSYCLTGLGHKSILACFLESLRMAADRHNGLHSAILDGIADLVADVNDPAETSDFIAQLQNLAIQYAFSITGVIHFNPGTEKTRGHLGSQFERKAETNLRLDKTNEIINIWSEKQRRAPIPKGSGPAFTWDDSRQIHVSCDPQQSATTKPGRRSIVDQIVFSNLHEFCAGCLPEGEPRKVIARRLESYLATKSIDASFDTCRRAVLQLVATQKLSKDPTSGLYFKGPQA